MANQTRPQPALFTYGTSISLRAPERRGARAPLILGVLVLTALVAVAVLAAFVWLATADYAALLGPGLDALRGLVSRA